MKRKRLTAPELDQLKQMLSEGNTAKVIAGHLGVSLATVNNYRAKFKKEGLDIKPRKAQNIRPAIAYEEPRKTIQHKKSGTKSIVKDYKFIVNGITISISGKAKEVSIGSEGKEVNF